MPHLQIGCIETPHVLARVLASNRRPWLCALDQSLGRNRCERYLEKYFSRSTWYDGIEAHVDKISCTYDASLKRSIFDLADLPSVPHLGASIVPKHGCDDRVSLLSSLKRFLYALWLGALRCRMGRGPSLTSRCQFLLHLASERHLLVCTPVAPMRVFRSKVMKPIVKFRHQYWLM